MSMSEILPREMERCVFCIFTSIYTVFFIAYEQLTRKRGTNNPLKRYLPVKEHYKREYLLLVGINI